MVGMGEELNWIWYLLRLVLLGGFAGRNEFCPFPKQATSVCILLYFFVGLPLSLQFISLAPTYCPVEYPNPLLGDNTELSCRGTHCSMLFRTVYITKHRAGTWRVSTSTSWMAVLDFLQPQSFLHSAFPDCYSPPWPPIFWVIHELLSCIVAFVALVLDLFSSP